MSGSAVLERYILWDWLARKDSNLQSPDPESGALPFGHSLSPSLFGKGWPNHELDGLVTREVAGNRQLILPIWHKVTKADVIGYSPSLADKLARSTADVTIDELADEIAGVVHPAEDAA